MSSRYALQRLRVSLLCNLKAGRTSQSSHASTLRQITRPAITQIHPSLAVVNASTLRHFATATPAPTPPSAAEATKLLPEFSLKNKVIAISGAAQGLGLTMAEALVESGAIGNLQVLTRNRTLC